LKKGYEMVLECTFWGQKVRFKQEIPGSHVKKNRSLRAGSA